MVSYCFLLQLVSEYVLFYEQLIVMRVYARIKGLHLIRLSGVIKIKCILLDSIENK